MQKPFHFSDHKFLPIISKFSTMSTTTLWLVKEIFYLKTTNWILVGTQISKQLSFDIKDYKLSWKFLKFVSSIKKQIENFNFEANLRHWSKKLNVFLRWKIPKTFLREIFQLFWNTRNHSLKSLRAKFSLVNFLWQVTFSLMNLSSVDGYFWFNIFDVLTDAKNEKIEPWSILPWVSDWVTKK